MGNMGQDWGKGLKGRARVKGRGQGGAREVRGRLEMLGLGLRCNRSSQMSTAINTLDHTNGRKATTWVTVA